MKLFLLRLSVCFLASVSSDRDEGSTARLEEGDATTMSKRQLQDQDSRVRTLRMLPRTSVRCGILTTTIKRPAFARFHICKRWWNRIRGPKRLMFYPRRHIGGVERFCLCHRRKALPWLVFAEHYSIDLLRLSKSLSARAPVRSFDVLCQHPSQ